MSRELLAELALKDVHISLDGDLLHVDGPEDVLTDGLIEVLRANKRAIVETLRHQRIKKGRAVFKYRLENLDWLIVITPTCTLQEIRQSLYDRFGERLREVQRYP